MKSRLGRAGETEHKMSKWKSGKVQREQMTQRLTQYKAEADWFNQAVSHSAAQMVEFKEKTAATHSDCYE